MYTKEKGVKDSSFFFFLLFLLLYDGTKFHLKNLTLAPQYRPYHWGERQYLAGFLAVYANGIAALSRHRPSFLTTTLAVRSTQ